MSNLKQNRLQCQHDKEVADTAGRLQQYFSRWATIATEFVVVSFIVVSTLTLDVLISGGFANRGLLACGRV
jgi:hypothetical protein